MQKWKYEDFEYNNRRLNIYLENAENAIVVLCVNDLGAQKFLCEKLQREMEFCGIDLQKSDKSFLRILESAHDTGQTRLLFYDVLLENTNYDLLRTMNVSRDVLRKIGVVILVVPTLFMEKMQLEMPNLYDYITLKLDYNVEYVCPLTPIYSEDHRDFLSKRMKSYKKKNALKNLKKPSEIVSIAEYYDYLECKQYIGVKSSDVSFMMDWLFKDMKEMLDAVQNFHDEIEDYTEVSVDAYYRTAVLLQSFGYYQDSIVLYDEIRHRRKAAPSTDILDMEALQGKCYCYYKSGEYALTLKMLRTLFEMLDSIDNVAWKAKICNDMGVCYYYLEQYDGAKSMWDQCEEMLRSFDQYDIKRRLRVMYNQNLLSCHVRIGQPKLTRSWYQLGADLEVAEQQYDLLYFQYLLMDSWLKFKKGDLPNAEKRIEEANALGADILPENDAMLIDLYDIWSLISLQLGKEGVAERLHEKEMRVGKNCGEKST